MMKTQEASVADDLNEFKNTFKVCVIKRLFGTAVPMIQFITDGYISPNAFRYHILSKLAFLIVSDTHATNFQFNTFCGATSAITIELDEIFEKAKVATKQKVAIDNLIEACLDVDVPQKIKDLVLNEVFTKNIDFEKRVGDIKDLQLYLNSNLISNAFSEQESELIKLSKLQDLEFKAMLDAKEKQYNELKAWLDLYIKNNTGTIQDFIKIIEPVKITHGSHIVDFVKYILNTNFDGLYFKYVSNDIHVAKLTK